MEVELFDSTIVSVATLGDAARSAPVGPRRPPASTSTVTPSGGLHLRVLRLGRRTLAGRRVRLGAPGRRRVALAPSRAEVELLLARSRAPRGVLLRLAGTFSDGDGTSRAALGVRLG